MPLYEYKCRACGTVTDIRHGFEETNSEACPSCGSADLGRVFNPAGIVFKGSGFYVTDSRKGGDSGAGSSSDSASSAKSESAGTKSESSAAKSEGSSPKSDGPSNPKSGAAA